MNPGNETFDVSGIDPLVRPLIPLFSELTAERVQRIRAALARDDRAEMKSLVHTVKGSAASYGFRSIADAALDLEAALKASAPKAEVEGRVMALAALDAALRVAITSHS